MLRVALKGLLGHKVRFALTAVAVVLGVAFVSGTFVLTDSMNDAFSGLFEDIFAETDVYVRAENPIADDLSAPPQPGLVPTMPEELVDQVRSVDGVNAAFGGVAGYAQFLDNEGEPIGGMGPPTFGFAWSDDDPTVTLRAGTAPSGPTEVVVDAATAEDHEFEVGGEVQILLNEGVRTFTVSGIVGFGEADNLLGATIAGFELPVAQALFDKEGEVDEVAVIGGPGVDADDLRNRIEDALAGRGVEVTTSQAEVEEQQEGIDGFLSIFSTVLLAFGGVALFVGAFIIANTFSIVVAQRMREFALLRAVGASTGQVRGAIIVEGLVLGVLASIVGLLLGVGVAALLKGAFAAFGIDIPSGGTIVAPRTIGVAFAVGIGVTLVASLYPSFRAARVAPVEAMRGTSEAKDGSTRRNVIGVVVTFLGMGAIFAGVFIGLGDALVLVGAGAAVTMLGVALAAPLLAGPFIHVAARLVDRFGMPGRLAHRNADRNPARTASTASALMIGLALVTFVTILASSINSGIAQALDEQFQADFVLSSEGAAGFGFVPTGVSADLEAAPELGAVSPQRLVPYASDDDTGTAVAVNVAAIDQLLDIGVVEGDVSELGEDEIFVSVDELEILELEVGDTIELTFPGGATVDAPIAGSFENADFVGSQLLVSLSTADKHAPNAQDVAVLATASGEIEAARAALEDVLEGYPGVQVQDQSEFRQSTEDQINQLLMLMIVLLALAVFIALLGITNTLALAVFERTREIGLLRAVGMDRRQTTRMILWESVLISVFGALLGLAVGIFFGWALLQAFADEGFEAFHVPVLQLVIYVVVAGFAGVVAAVAPGWRAARVDVLEAVTTE